MSVCDKHTPAILEVTKGGEIKLLRFRAKAVPEVLLKVVEAKRLLDSGKLESGAGGNRCCWHK